MFEFFGYAFDNFPYIGEILIIKIRFPLCSCLTYFIVKMIVIKIMNF